MEKKIDGIGKMKSVASIPANYVSILELQERWLKAKERKHKGKELLLKQKIDGDEGVVKVVEAIEPREKKLEAKGLSMRCGVNRWKKEPKKEEELEVSTTTIVSNKDENGGDLRGTKKNNPVKVDTRRAFTSKGEKDSIAEETNFHDRWIKKRLEDEGETREVNGHGRTGYHRNNQRHDRSSTRLIRTASTMVWVKKCKNDAAAGKNGV